MKYIGNIQSQANAEVFAVASGALPNGKPVVVNSNGTVSVAGESTSSATQAVGTAAEFDGGIGGNYIALAFDTNAERIVVFFQDTGNSNRGTARVGTVSADNNNISWGTAVVVNSGTTDYVNITYDSTSQKVVLNYRDSGNSHYGTAIVGTVNPSDNSISFGSETVYNSNNTTHQSAAYDAGANKHVIFYRNHGDSQKGYSIVGTVSGTSISFGSAVKFYDSDVGILGPKNAIYDPSSQKCVITFRTNSDEHGTCMLATVSGTSVSFAGGSEGFKFESNAMGDAALAYDIINEKVVISYYLSSGKGKAVVATTSGTSISYGTPVVFADAFTANTCITYDANARRNVIFFRDPSDSNRGKVIVGTVSGTTISFSGYTETQFESGTTELIVCDYDSVNQRPVVAFKDSSDGSKGKYVVFRTGYSNTLTNLTSENFLGFTGGEVTPQVLTSAVFEAASMNEGNAVYDSNSDKVVIVYRDGGNSEKGTAIVGTVSGSSITFGTAVVFQAQTLSSLSCAFDSNLNKVVIAYAHDSDSTKGKAIVGTVSGTDISFGNVAEFEGGALKSDTSTTFDSSNNKIIIAYLDDDDSDKGKAVVGTVSGTDISFGTPAVFNNSTTREPNVTFDSNSNKVVVAFQDHGNSSQGTAVVGTVSGTDISFGSETIFNAASTEYPRLTFDSSNNKVLVFFKDGGDSSKGKVIVGTVSGTGISFGTEVDTGAVIGSNDLRIGFNTSTNKAVIAYRNTSNSSYGTLQLGTVSGTSISLESAIVFNSASSNVYSIVFDPDTNQTVIVYRNGGNSNYGTTSIFVPEVRPEIADGKTATIQVGGAINTKQLSLTAGQQYFVQTDGTIGTTAASPSVIAGTAVSATDLIVKG